MLCPLAFEVDETYLDTNGRLTVCPFNIRLLIFNVAACKSVDASTTWFFLPNDDAEAAHHEAKTEAVHKVQNLHNAMRECFKDLKYMMDNNIGMEWKLWYGGEEHDVVLKFALAFVVSDTAMHDKLCCHYGTRNMNIKAICRHCDCPTVELSSFKTFLKCKSWRPEELDPTVDPEMRNPSTKEGREYWQGISHYPVKNALDELEHGSNRAKTHLNTCGEVLHMHQKGAMKRVIEALVYAWTNGKGMVVDDVEMSVQQKNINKSLSHLNNLGHQMGSQLARQSDRNKPRTKFKNSLFVTTKKCAHEQQGVLLCVLLALLTDRGRQICMEERTMRKAWLENQIHMLELILMVEVFLKRDRYPKEWLDPAALGAAMGHYMDLMVDICQRDGMGNLLSKNHLMFHIPQYVLRWGPPTVFDTAVMESGHKTESKRPAQLTQQRPQTFMTQLPDRYSDRRIIKRFRDFFKIDRLLDDSLGPQEEDTNTTEQGLAGLPVATGSRFTLGIDDQNGKPSVLWNKRRMGTQVHNQTVVDLVAAIVLSKAADGANDVIHGFTEYKMGIEGEAQIFRAHPCYRSASRQRKDVWYDWAHFDLSGYRGFSKYLLPCQILMFIHVPFLQGEVKFNGIKLAPKEPHAVVRAFRAAPSELGDPQQYRGKSVPYSFLVKCGRLRDEYNIIPCRHIKAPAMVVPNEEVKEPPANQVNTASKKRAWEELHRKDIKPLGRAYFVISPREEWGECFGSLVQSFI